VTLRVEQQPLEWVLEQIAVQSGWSDVKARARPVASSAAAAPSPTRDTAAQSQAHCAEPAAPVDADRVLHAVAHGSEAERLLGLVQARSEGVAVPEQTLKSLVETDPSERVRIAAFDSYLERRSNRAALREALEAALYVPSAAIQREAMQRLAEVREMERSDALPPYGGP
jgi:hypothetical protein